MKKINEEMTELIDKAVAGDKESLELLIKNIQDMVFNLSLRMLGTFSDAEDAAQDILFKVVTHLSLIPERKFIFNMGVSYCFQSFNEL